MPKLSLKPAPLPELVGGRLLWRLKEAAEALGISPRSLRRMDELGELPKGAVVHLQIDGQQRPPRRFAVEVLAEWIRRGCPRP